MPSVNRFVPFLVFAGAAFGQNGTSRAVDQTSGAVTVALGHSQTEFGGPFVPLMNMSLGNPPQEVTAVFDTGSSDLIVPDPKGGFCKQPSSDCEPPAEGGNGAFDPSKAKITDINTELRTGFVNGESEEGKFIKAAASLGGADFTDLQFGLIRSGRAGPDQPEASLLPIMGVASPLSEADGVDTYPNLPARMKDSGLTKSRVVSVYTNDFRGNDGSVTFGGVDKAKFKGELQEAPIVDTPRPGDDGDDRQEGDSGPTGGQKKDGKQSKQGDGWGNNGRSGRQAVDSREWRGWKTRGSRMRVLVKRAEKGDNKDVGDKKGDGDKKDAGDKDSRAAFFVELSSVAFVPDEEGKGKNSGDKGNGEGRRGSADQEGDAERNGGDKSNGDREKGKGKDGKNRRGGNRDRGNEDDGESKNKNSRNKRVDSRSNKGKKKDGGSDNRKGGSNGNDDGRGNGRKKGRGNGNDNGKTGNGQRKVNKDGSVNLLPGGEKGPALIDTGNPEAQIPEPALRNLAKELGADFNQSNGIIGTFDCSKARGSVRFGFNSDKAMVDVPIEMMLVPKKITRSEGCDLAMSVGETVSLGSPFLQGAYVVFDDEKKRLMFAQAAINTTRSDVQAVGANWDGKMKGTG